jgi:hypothetical protein
MLDNKSYIERHQEEEPDQSRKIRLRSFERHPHPKPTELFVINIDIRGPACINSHTPQRPFLLFIRQELRCSWRIRHEEEANDTEGNGHCAFN